MSAGFAEGIQAIAARLAAAKQAQDAANAELDGALEAFDAARPLAFTITRADLTGCPKGRWDGPHRRPDGSCYCTPAKDGTDDRPAIAILDKLRPINPGRSVQRL